MSTAATNATAPSRLIDLILAPEWIIPVEPQGVVLTGHAIAIHQGEILEVLPIAEMTRSYQASTYLTLPGEVALPGLINLHCHAAMTLLRGFADDLPLMTWLQKKIWPAEAKLASPDFVKTGSLLACLEMLRGGITCFNDMYFFPEQTVEAALETGIRASIGLIVIDFPTAYAATSDEYFAKGLELFQRYRDHAGVSFCLAPHAPYTVSDASLLRCGQISRELNLPIHTHLHETREEVRNESSPHGKHGQRPLQRLQQLGLLDQRLIGVHAVHLLDEEIALLGESRVHLAHCPTSNLKLGSGLANTSGWLSHGINVGLGTDGAASNNRLDLWQEMRQASLLAKGMNHDAAVMASHQVLHAATLGGAKALGIVDRVGSIVAGKSADLITVNLGNWITQPVYDPASHLVYVSERADVSNVWVQGQHLVSDGALSYKDMEPLMESVCKWQQRARLL